MNTPSSQHGTLRSYTVGFILSVALTFGAYYVVVHHLVPNAAVPFLIGLAMLQLLVQLLFFLHLGREASPRWNTLAFLFSFTIVAILVVGSLWIMYHLDYSHDLSPAQVIQDEGISP